MARKQAVPIRWMAPETLRYTKFSTASDVWSYGITIWEIYTLGERPYYLLSNENILPEIVSGLTLEIPECCPEPIKTIMKQCWGYYPDDRCPFEDIVSIINERNDIEKTSCIGPIPKEVMADIKYVATNINYDLPENNESNIIEVESENNSPNITESEEYPLNSMNDDNVSHPLFSNNKLHTRKMIVLAICMLFGLITLSIVLPVTHFFRKGNCN